MSLFCWGLCKDMEKENEIDLVYQSESQSKIEITKAINQIRINEISKSINNNLVINSEKNLDISMEEENKYRDEKDLKTKEIQKMPGNKKSRNIYHKNNKNINNNLLENLRLVEQRNCSIDLKSTKLHSNNSMMEKDNKEIDRTISFSISRPIFNNKSCN